MELNINSPEYYSKEHGVDDEIYWLGRAVSKVAKENNYSEKVRRLDITPIVIPEKLIEKGLGKEITQHISLGTFVTVSKRINYNTYVNAPIEEKRRLIVENILKSVKAIKGKGKIDYEQFERDILKISKYAKEELQEYCLKT